MPSTPAQKSRNHNWLWVVVVLLLGADIYLYWRQPGAAARTEPVSPDQSAKKAGRGGGNGAIPVVAARARRGNIGVYFSGLGSVTPIYSVTVKTRVDGQ